MSYEGNPLAWGGKGSAPSAPVGVEADILRIVNTAIEVCNDRDRPAMAEDLEAVRLYVEQASANLAQQPAAVDEAVIRYALDHARDLDDGVARVVAALAAQPGGEP